MCKSDMWHIFCQNQCGPITLLRLLLIYQYYYGIIINIIIIIVMWLPLTISGSARFLAYLDFNGSLILISSLCIRWRNLSRLVSLMCGKEMGEVVSLSQKRRNVTPQLSCLCLYLVSSSWLASVSHWACVAGLLMLVATFSCCANVSHW